ncbi:MAG: hypothetical protein VYE22_12420 [Myxococcota bacterium]|nr:hypothetical protein [Myxococcota bacterium]
MRPLVPMLLLLAPLPAAAQPSLFPEYDRDDPRSRRHLPRSPEVEALESEHGVPPCGAESWGRSRLDGALASRPRDADLPCREVWDADVRFEVGLVGGGRLEAPDGGWGGLSIQLGLRFHDVFSVMFQSLALFGRWDLGQGERLRGASWNAFLFELSPVDRLAVGLGPSMDLEAGCDLDAFGAPSACGYTLGYGAHARVTLQLATLPFGGLTLTGDLHAAFGEGAPQPTMLLGLGLRL